MMDNPWLWPDELSFQQFENLTKDYKIKTQQMVKTKKDRLIELVAISGCKHKAIELLMDEVMTEIEPEFKTKATQILHAGIERLTKEKGKETK